MPGWMYRLSFVCPNGWSSLSDGAGDEEALHSAFLVFSMRPASRQAAAMFLHPAARSKAASVFGQ